MGWVIPDGCRLCARPLAEPTRYPVCSNCLDAIQPFGSEHACAACRAPFLNRRPLDENGVCGLCRLGLTAYDNAHSYGSYDGALRRLIHLFKYHRIPSLAPALAPLMLRALPRDRVFDVIVPVPMHWWKRFTRGFNQTELLARRVSRSTGLPWRDALRRRRHAAPQAGLTQAGRRRNVAGVFRARPDAAVRGASVLLIDDVITTGATASACASALKQAGARAVTVLSLARADRRQWAAGLAPAHSLTRTQGAAQCPA